MATRLLPELPQGKAADNSNSAQSRDSATFAFKAESHCDADKEQPA